MYYVYLLKSNVNKDIYVGFTGDLKIRYEQHNSGQVTSTKAYRPWTLIYYEAYSNKEDAVCREKQLKMHAAKSALLRQMKNYLSSQDVKIA